MSETHAAADISPQPPPLSSEPRPQHRWLQRLLGDWTYSMDVPAHDGQPASKATGTERFRAIGDLWVVGEAQGEMPGGGASTTIMTLGYDIERGRFVGSWIGSMMSMLWTYDGDLDPAGRVLTLHSIGPTADGKGTTKYQDIIEFTGDDVRSLTAKYLAPDGQWTLLMSMEYRRTR